MKKIELKRIFLSALLILINSCSLNNEAVIDLSDISDQQKKPTTFVYECQSGYSFIVNIEGRMAWIFLPDQTVGLPKVTSASGTKYTDGRSTFWSKGNKATLERAGVVYKDCVNNPGKAIWEDAKLNGVDFRAVGNEPGWHLEITHDDELVFTRQYGKTAHVFSTPLPQIDESARKTKYLIQEKGHSLTVTILGVECRDTMIDVSYESTVTVVHDDKVYKGCGKALH